MSSEAEIRRVLQVVARELVPIAETTPGYQLMMDGVQGVLERRLLPLLLAGQAMRDIWPERTKVPWPVGWDAALRAAQSQGQEAEKET